MKGKPIIFSGPMVRAILEDRKTQTRRILKPQPPKGIENTFPYPRIKGGNILFHANKDTDFPSWEHFIKCQYQKGDLLWVRETFVQGYELDEDDCPIGEEKTFYRADADGDLLWHDDEDPESYNPKWKPSIFMPRYASRITLEVTDVRVERLKDISVEDAIAEGATSKRNCHGYKNLHDGWSMNWPDSEPENGWGQISLGSPIYAFANFICKLHGGEDWNLKPSNLWDENPWIVAVTFKAHKCNIDRITNVKT